LALALDGSIGVGCGEFDEGLSSPGDDIGVLAAVRRRKSDEYDGLLVSWGPRVRDRCGWAAGGLELGSILWRLSSVRRASCRHGGTRARGWRVWPAPEMLGVASVLDDDVGYVSIRCIVSWPFVVVVCAIVVGGCVDAVEGGGGDPETTGAARPLF
jgi:predicted small secreted protein